MKPSLPTSLCSAPHLLTPPTSTLSSDSDSDLGRKTSPAVTIVPHAKRLASSPRIRLGHGHDGDLALANRAEWAKYDGE